FTVSGSHTYADEGSYTVRVVLADDAPGTASATASGAVGVAEGDGLVGFGQTLAATPGASVSGRGAAFPDTYSGNVAPDFTASIAWGDGTTTAGTVTGGSGTFTVGGSHTYASPGAFSVTVSLSDVGGTSATAHDTASVAAPPTTVGAFDPTTAT